MTYSCPLPVDWLDYLEGSRSDLSGHLAECPSCRAVIASLADTSVPTGWANPFVGRTDAVWHEDKPAQPAVAEFWFSTPAFEIDHVPGSFGVGKGSAMSYANSDRVLLLVIGEPAEHYEMSWLDAVPVLS